MATTWRILNSDRLEVTPSTRKRTWNNLLIDYMLNSPLDETYRTGVNKANFKNFDYNTPIVYEVANKKYLTTNEFMNKALNKPSGKAAPIQLTSLQIALAFICSVLIALIAAFFSTHDNERTSWTN